MEKINGYTKEEAQSLVKFVCEGKGQGKTLTRIFEEYAKNSGRARGSVRNYYYALLKSTDNNEVREILKNTQLKAEDIRPFTDEETDRILKAILKERSRGISVRRAVLNLAEGDDKLMLRYQNKYRNVLAKQPERIKKLMRDAGYNVTDDGRKAIEDKINSLYDELNASLKEENKRLTAVIKKLTDENFLLKLQVKNLQN
ncbi:MAG: hypothetical protein K2N50_02365 [Clostridia bacterium]|nr:hypothetical protein [Clostridia bacterium]MDE7256785.1 hypothetical protein [Clostridia bacterium]